MKKLIPILILVLSIQYTYSQNSDETPLWGEYHYLLDQITLAQAATVRITMSTAVMISPTHAITAAHSPLDENNEITENLTVANIFGEVRKIIDVKYNIDADFAIVELESPFENSYAVEISSLEANEGDATFAVGHPKDVVWGAVGWAVSFGPARGISFENYFNLFDIQITNGFSGGGIFNDKGQLVGIIVGLTSAFSEGSIRDQNYNINGFFREEFEILDGPWKFLNTYQSVAVSLGFINNFMETNTINNTPSIQNVDLPTNKPDRIYDSLTDQEEEELRIIANPLRKSTVAISVSSLSESSYPNGSGVFISDRIIATNSHVIEGKVEFIITLFDGTEIKGATVLANHPEMDVSLILLNTPAPETITPVKIADIRPSLGDKGFLIGHPSDLWATRGGWQVSSARSGYMRDQIDDRGDILFEGYASGGMSGGPIFNSKGELVGINYAGGSSVSQTLSDYQDPHSTAYYPIVSPENVNISGVDFFGVKDLIDQNSIYFSKQTSQTSAFETKYFSSISGGLYLVKKDISNSDQLVKIEEVIDNDFVEAASFGFPINDADNWSIVDCLNDNDNYLFVQVFSKNSELGVNISKLNTNFELETSFGTNGHFTDSFSSLGVKRIVKAVVYNDILYLLTQKSQNQLATFSVDYLNLSSPSGFQNILNSTTEITANSNYYPVDFNVNSDGIFIAGTTDYADDSVSVFSRTFDHFIANYLFDGSINASFGNNGIVQKDFGDTDKASSLHRQSDGKLLLAGMNWLDAAPNAIVTRFNVDGTIDTNFGTEGTTWFGYRDHTDLGREEATDIFVDTLGNIYLSGSKYIGRTINGNLTASDGEYQSVVWKYDSSGKLVEEFGSFGMATLPVSGADKIQKLQNIDDQLIATVAARRENGTSNVVFSISMQSGRSDKIASDDFDDDGIMNDKDLCPNTPTGESVDENGCSDSQKDTDEDTITDDIDLCPNTPSGETVDSNGCSDSQKDTDEDTITDDIDLCPNTPSGEDVNSNGCFYLPSDNFSIQVISETCPTKKNGQIIISPTNKNYNYVVSIDGNQYNFTDTKTIIDLQPITYDFCISIPGIDSFQQCYTVEIGPGTTVSGKSSTISNKTSIKITQGTSPYTIFINGKEQFKTSIPSFSVDITSGDLIEVKTSVECEGVFSKSIELSDEIIVYPNPTKGNFEISLPVSQKEVVIELYTINSQFISVKTYPIRYGRVQLSLKDKPVGIYIIKVLLDNPISLKIIKE